MQEVNVGENITTVTFSNAVVNTGDANSGDVQQAAPNISILLKQDATGRSITFPTGTNYFYTGGVNSIVASANARHWVMVTASSRRDAGLSSAIDYYISISPAFENV